MFAAAQHDASAMRRSLRILTEGVAHSAFPATVPLALVCGAAVIAQLESIP